MAGPGCPDDLSGVSSPNSSRLDDLSMAFSLNSSDDWSRVSGPISFSLHFVTKFWLHRDRNAAVSLKEVVFANGHNSY